MAASVEVGVVAVLLATLTSLVATGGGLPLSDVLAWSATGLCLLIGTLFCAMRLERGRHKAAAAALALPGEEVDADLIEQDPVLGSLTASLRRGRTFVLHVRGVWRSYFGRSQVLATCEPALARELLNNRAHSDIRAERYKAGMLLPGLAGVLWMEGEPWKAHTAALKPVFQAANFGRHAAALSREAHAVVDGWTDGEQRPLLESLREVGMQLVMVAGYGLEPGSPLAAKLTEAINGYDEKARLKGVAEGHPMLALPRFLRGVIRIYWDAQRIRRAVADVCEDRLSSAKDGTIAAPQSETSAVDWIGRMMVCQPFSLNLASLPSNC